MGRFLAAIIAIVGWFALILQFALTMTSPANQAIPVGELIVRYFSFFTIHMNIFVSLVATAVAFGSQTRIGSFLTRPTIQAAVVTFLSIGGLVYSLFLRSVWDPQGWQAVADHALHDVTPVLFLIYWLIFAPKADLTWADPLKWLAYPAAYVVYSIVRGVFVNWYPYHFADVSQLGYPTALINAGFVLTAFLIAGMIFIAIAKLLTRSTASMAT